MHRHNVEPTVEELLSDPIVHLLMLCDRLEPEHVWACVNNARQRLALAARKSARSSRSPRDRRLKAPV
jgi:hypothetical protein